MHCRLITASICIDMAISMFNVLVAIIFFIVLPVLRVVFPVVSAMVNLPIIFTVDVFSKRHIK